MHTYLSFRRDHCFPPRHFNKCVVSRFPWCRVNALYRVCRVNIERNWFKVYCCCFYCCNCSFRKLMFLLLAANETTSDSCIPIYRSDLVIASPLVNATAAWPPGGPGAESHGRRVNASRTPRERSSRDRMIANASGCTSLCALILALECLNTCKTHHFLFSLLHLSLAYIFKAILIIKRVNNKITNPSIYGLTSANIIMLMIRHSNSKHVFIC